MSSYQSEQFPIPTPGRLQQELRLPRPPLWMVTALILLIVATWIPLYLIYRARVTMSDKPRIHVFFDMDKQPRRGPQTGFAGFVDGRAMRQPVAGTIARGRLQIDQDFHNGIVRDPVEPAGAFEFVDKIPVSLTVDERFLAQGKQQFLIYCAVCHGDDGRGNGLVNQRAIELKETKWVPATNLMTQEIRERRDGQIFQAIRDGVRNMPGYAAQLEAEDRWAVVAWLRRLQADSPVAPNEAKQ